jgi:hypothetical protein
MPLIDSHVSTEEDAWQNISQIEQVIQKVAENRARVG